jgi:anti-sigma factor RsiW
VIFRRHPRALLLRAAEGSLDHARRSRLEAHLGTCAACRDEMARIERAIGALATEPRTGPSEAGRQRLLLAARVGVSSRRVSHLLLAGAAATIAAVATGMFFAAARVRVVPAAGEPVPFEALALAAHRQLDGAAPELDLASGDAATIRDWLTANGYSAALPSERPGEREDAFRILGARAVETHEQRGAAIATRIDGRAVTLLVGREEEVSGIPAWSWLGKRLLVRRDSRTGAHLLSWRNSGKAYTLVTEDDERPERACLLCHVDTRRKRAIERVAGSL